MGHSAKYGIYSMLCCDLQKIVHFELLQVRYFITDITEPFRISLSLLAVWIGKKALRLIQFYRPTRQAAVTRWNSPALKDVFPS